MKRVFDLSEDKLQDLFSRLIDADAEILAFSTEKQSDKLILSGTVEVADLKEEFKEKYPEYYNSHSITVEESFEITEDYATALEYDKDVTDEVKSWLDENLI